MCVGLSARVVSVKGGSAVIDASGARRTVSAELLDELEPGDYVMVHAGIAIAKISSSSEEETTQIMEQLDEKPAGNN
jgi:hydrogenase expression/formation protein HypC